MSNSPLSDFIGRAKLTKPEDFAALFFLMSVRERTGFPISPSAPSLLRGIGISDESDGRSCVARLVEAGELVWFSNDRYQGYEIPRYDEFVGLITNFGHRRYNRIAASKRRNTKADQ